MGDKLIKFDLPIIVGEQVLENAYANGFFSLPGTAVSTVVNRYFGFWGKRKLIDQLILSSFCTYHVQDQDREVFLHKGIE